MSVRPSAKWILTPAGAISIRYSLVRRYAYGPHADCCRSTRRPCVRRRARRPPCRRELATSSAGRGSQRRWPARRHALHRRLAPLPVPRARPGGPPNWTRQRKIMLVAILWRRQTAAALTPGCSASITIASFSASVKLRRFDRPSRAGAAVAASVKLFSTSCSLAALLAPLLIVARTLG